MATWTLGPNTGNMSCKQTSDEKQRPQVWVLGQAHTGFDWSRKWRHCSWNLAIKLIQNNSRSECLCPQNGDGSRNCSRPVWLVDFEDVTWKMYEDVLWGCIWKVNDSKMLLCLEDWMFVLIQKILHLTWHFSFFSLCKWHTLHYALSALFCLVYELYKVILCEFDSPSAYAT